MHIRILSLLLFFTYSQVLKSQDSLYTTKNLGEVLFPKKNNTDSPIETKLKKNSLILLPVIGTTPATGVFFGVGGLWAFYTDKYQKNKLSSFNFGAQITFKNQYIFMLKENMYAMRNKIFLQGDYRFLIFSQPTFGLGTNSPDSTYTNFDFGMYGYGTSKIDGAQMMYYNYLKIHQILSYAINDNNTIYVGGGFHLDNHSKIRDELYEINNQNKTAHSVYSISKGFDLYRYNLIGLSANFVWDTRDNIINTYKGFYINFNYRMNSTFIGSSQFSNMLWLEGRCFLPVSKKSKRNVLAFWTYLSTVVSGDLPYLDLPAIGYDQKGFSGRGYVQGRYRGNTLFYSEVEYRFRISKCSEVLGGVVFVNAVTTNDKDNNVHMFEYIRPSVGVGIRVMLDKKVRTNLVVDYGNGYQSSGVYLTAGEMF
jgi:hypothetical protein